MKGQKKLKSKLHIEKQKTIKLQAQNEVLEQTINSNKQLIEEMTDRDNDTTLLNICENENVIQMKMKTVQ